MAVSGSCSGPVFPTDRGLGNEPLFRAGYCVTGAQAGFISSRAWAGTHISFGSGGSVRLPGISGIAHTAPDRSEYER